MNQLGTGQGAIEEIASSGQLAGVAARGASSRLPIAQGEYAVIYCTGLGAVSNQLRHRSGSPFESSFVHLHAANRHNLVGVSATGNLLRTPLPRLRGSLSRSTPWVPAGITPGSATNLILSIGGVQSNTVTIATQ